MPELGLLPLYSSARRPAFTPGVNFHYGRRRHSGVLSGGRMGFISAYNSKNFGIRSDSPFESPGGIGQFHVSENIHLTFILWAHAGVNTVTLPVQIVGVIERSPTLGLLPSPNVTTPPTAATILPAGPAAQNLVLTFSATLAGRVYLVFEWNEPKYNGALDLGAMTVA